MLHGGGLDCVHVGYLALFGRAGRFAWWHSVQCGACPIVTSLWVMCVEVELLNSQQGTAHIVHASSGAQDLSTLCGVADCQAQSDGICVKVGTTAGGCRGLVWSTV